MTAPVMNLGRRQFRSMRRGDDTKAVHWHFLSVSEMVHIAHRGIAQSITKASNFDYGQAITSKSRMRCWVP